MLSQRNHALCSTYALPVQVQDCAPWLLQLGNIPLQVLELLPDLAQQFQHLRLAFWFGSASCNHGWPEEQRVRKPCLPIIHPRPRPHQACRLPRSDPQSAGWARWSPREVPVWAVVRVWAVGLAFAVEAAGCDSSRRDLLQRRSRKSKGCCSVWSPPLLGSENRNDMKRSSRRSSTLLRGLCIAGIAAGPRPC